MGVEVDASAAQIDGANTCLVGLTPIGGVNCGATVEALGTIAGRIGYAFGRTLVFVKGGGAWVEDRFALNVGVGAGAFTRSIPRGGAGRSAAASNMPCCRT